MGTATLWEIQMRAWSYKHGLSIPAKQQKQDFVGGLSRLVKVGYSTDVLKLDFSSLYPSIQLVHDVFPDCDITGVMKGMLTYFRNARIMYKQLAEEFEKSDPVKSKSYDRKQLPIKIFINSMFGALSAPQVFHWGDMNQGERITCTGRQYLRQMIKFFMNRGYDPLVMDTDGVNFSSPSDVHERKYIGKGLNWKVVEGKEYIGAASDIAEYNDLFMKGEMALDNDGVWPSCINLARKNYALMTDKGKIKLVGNTIKSKKLPGYIEEFLDKGIKMLLTGQGYEFVQYYYQYFDKIYNREIPLAKIATKARVKKSVSGYANRGTDKNGRQLAKQAHMELAIKHNLQVNLGDTIYYVNNGKTKSHGDAQEDKHGNMYATLVPNDIIENQPDFIGEYNVPKYLDAFNSRLKPLMVAFDKEIRDLILITKPEQKRAFLKSELELVNDQPDDIEDQDTLQDFFTPSDMEMEFWEKKEYKADFWFDKDIIFRIPGFGEEIQV